MATFVVFHTYIEKEAEKKIDLGSDVIKMLLTNTAPTQSTGSVKGDITEISAGNGYTTGGLTVTVTSSAQSSGVYKWVLVDLVVAASGGSIGPYRYGVLYSDTSTNDDLIGYIDIGSAETTGDGSTLTFDFDATNGVLQKTIT